MERGARVVGPRRGGVIGAGKALVAVPREDRVDAGQAGKRPRRVLHHRAIRAGINAGMGHQDHDIGPSGTDHRQPCARGLDHVAGGQAVAEMGVIPCRDLRRQEAEQADAQAVPVTVGIAHPARQDQVGGQQGLILNRGRAGLRYRIGAGQGKARLSERLAQPVEAEVEFVIAKGRCVIAHEVHRVQHRVPAAPAPTGLCGQVAERRALQEIAVVEQQAVPSPRRGAGLSRARRKPCQPIGPVACVGVIVEGQDMAVYIRGLEHAQPYCCRGYRLGGGGIGELGQFCNVRWPGISVQVGWKRSPDPHATVTAALPRGRRWHSRSGGSTHHKLYRANFLQLCCAVPLSCAGCRYV
nr:hypothetical protein [Roseovarius azorensis]